MRKALYTDLVTEVATSIQNGELSPGARLPTHRAFAEQHGVALATATRAYKELKRRGLVSGESGRGVFVRDQGVPTTLGVEQTPADGSINLVFNMPGDAADSELLRAGLKRLAAAGDLEAMLRYQPHSGRPHERKIVSTYLSRTLGDFPIERVLLTSGGQHGLAITALALFQPGDVIGTDHLTYPGFKSVASLHGLTLAPIDGEDGCMNADGLERGCRNQKLRAIYLTPTVHSPLGTVISAADRLRLIEIARRYDLLVIEDNSAYAFLEPNPPHSLLSLAPERTIHIGGFSKSLATGLRFGFLIAPQEHVSQLTHAIRATIWNTPALITALVTGWIEDGALAKSEDTRRSDGAERQSVCRDVFKEMAIMSHRNASYAWLPLRDGQRAEPIITRLAKMGIAVTGAEPFSVKETHPQAIRVAFGGIPHAELRATLEIVRDTINSDAIP